MRLILHGDCSFESAIDTHHEIYPNSNMRRPPFNKRLLYITDGKNQDKIKLSVIPRLYHGGPDQFQNGRV